MANGCLVVFAGGSKIPQAEESLPQVAPELPIAFAVCCLNQGMLADAPRLIELLAGGREILCIELRQTEVHVRVREYALELAVSRTHLRQSSAGINRLPILLPRPAIFLLLDAHGADCVERVSQGFEPLGIMRTKGE